MHGKIKERTGEIYHFIIIAVLILRAAIWLLPFPADPYGALRLTVWVLFDVFFLLMGLGGLCLWRSGLLGYDLASAVATLPAAHFVALLVVKPWHLVIVGLWYSYIGYLSIRHRKRRQLRRANPQFG